MKIRQWLGFNEDASQYLLRPGELRILNNLQSARPGMLHTRRGLRKIYGQWDNEAIYGLYRRATVFGNPSDFLWFQKALVERQLSLEQSAAHESPYEYVWNVRRIEGNQTRIIDTIPLKPGGTTEVTNFSVAEDRHGRFFMFYGHGARPKMYRPDKIANVAVAMGMDAPTAAPAVTPSGSGFFIEGVDVQSGGGAYFDPPDLTVNGGSPDRPAKLKAIVQSGNVIGVDIVDGGSNFQSTPTISVASARVGTGFRAKGTIVASARTVQGFLQSDPGSVSATGAATSDETYGSTNGTTGNSIMYRVRNFVRTERMVSYTNSNPASTMTLGGVTGLEAGDRVFVSPPMEPFISSNITIDSINATAKTVVLRNNTLNALLNWTPTAATAYDVTFERAATALADATYDSAARRFTATVPLRTSLSNGSGAQATLTFAPKPLGYSASAVSVTTQNWMTYKSEDKNNQFGQYINYLYGEFWEGSDYDVKGTVQNSRYAGLQASGSRYVRGFSGSINGKRADVYWPDYSKISVWLCTGTASGNSNQWTRQDVTVQYETSGAKYIQFQLPPTRPNKQIRNLGGASIATGYQSNDELPDAVQPTVKLYLTDCPDKWVVSGSQCLPTATKESQINRLPWWADGTLVSRPIVGVSPLDQPLTSSAVTVVSGGSGWQQGTAFKFRLYQANPYDQFVDYNTAVVEDAIPRAHQPYEKNNRFCEFTLTAGAPDNLTPHGPPNTLVQPATVDIAGEGYVTNQTATITLLKRGLAQTVSSAATAEVITFTAKNLSTLTGSSTNSIGSITILNKGRNYPASPAIEVRGGGAGYGLSVRPTVVDGRIESVEIVDPGLGYTAEPELYTSSRPAELTPVMRPAMRGKYRCAFRYADMSETVVKTVTATLGDSSTTLTLSDVEGVEPNMILESTSLPHYTRIKSVSGNQVIINQEATGLAPNTTITVTVRDLTKPIAYSDLSPIADVDAGPNDDRTHSAVMTWSIPGATPPDRADKVELWRTSGDQSLVFYRVEAYGRPTSNGIEIVGADTLTDEELFDPERPHYAALPVVLPNGNLNAYRFGKPRTDLSACVAFQDRLWMAVSTSGRDANTLYYSEFDEFESTPDANELPIQNNTRSTDVLTALVPFGSLLLAMQNQHTYAIQYNSDPAVDSSIQMFAHRGCLHQRCWDMHENTLYAADESGIYALARNGEVAEIGLPLRNYFVGEVIDFSKRETFFLQVDPRTHVLRFFCVLKTNVTSTPSVALCYDIQAKTWWTESYPNSITAACTGRPGVTRINTALMGAVDGNLYEIDGNSDHANDALTDTFVSDGGSGYREAPTITVPNCKGAVVQGVVSEGRLVDVIIQNAGWEAKWGIDLLAENGGQLLAEDERPLQVVEYHPIRLDIGPPEPGGVQAVAYANFTITPKVVRSSTVSLGEDFVRLDPARIRTFEPDSTAILSTEAGLRLHTQSNLPIATEPVPVEVGMEAIGEYIPLNAFVSRIDRNDVHLAHPDGTPVSMLYGDPRSLAQTPIAPIRVLLAGGILSFNNWAFTAVPSYAWGGGEADLTVLATIPTPTGSATVSVQRSLDLYLANFPDRTLTYASLEVILVDACNRIVGWARTSTSNVEGTTNGTGGYFMTVTPGQFPSTTVAGWYTGALSEPPGTPGALLGPLVAYRNVTGTVPGLFPPVTRDGTTMLVTFYKPFRTHIPFRMATGFMQLANEENTRNGDSLIDRSVSLVYAPTPGDKEIEIIERFNGRDEMRPNLMRRSRGGPSSFVHRQDSASTVLNIGREASALGFATGVATARFASRSHTDLTGEDQHLQVELHGRPTQASPWDRINFWNPDPSIKAPQQFVMHSLTINGVVEDAE